MTYLLEYRKWKKLHEAQLGAGEAEEYAARAGIDVKQIAGKSSSELTSGGSLDSMLIDVVKDLESMTGYQFTATGGNDEFHQNLDKVSNHKLGRALDIVFKESSSADARKKVETALLTLMLSGKYDTNGNRLSGINEYDSPAKHATAGHFHISITPDLPNRDGVECSFPLNRVMNYSMIRNLKGQGKKQWPTGTIEFTQKVDSSDVSSQINSIILGKKLLTSGSTGEIVKLAQAKLKEKGFLTKEPSGEYDADTYNAVKEFQKNNKDASGASLKVDGIIGPKTAVTLFGKKNSSLNKDSKISPKIKDYDDIVATVIDTLEGGYYHPDMLKDGRIKDTRYRSSGETMMGIDRSAGGEINSSPDGKEFWKLIDDANAKTNWKWLYRGGPLEPKLRQLAGKMIKPQFEEFSKKYLSDEAKPIVFNDGRLLFNFIYATWNGPKWFKKFAKEVNAAVEKGITDPNELIKIAVSSRTQDQNSLIAQAGSKIEKIVGLA